MLSRLLALFVIVPALELYLLIRIGQTIGALETFAIILVTGVIGSFLAKTQGWLTFAKLQSRLASGQVPGKELADGAIILVSGALLITPGVLTDVIGFLGLIPFTRNMIRDRYLPRLIESFRSGKSSDGHVRVQFSSFGSGFSTPGMRPGHNNGHTTNPGNSGDSGDSGENPGESDSGTSVSGSARKRPGYLDN